MRFSKAIAAAWTAYAGDQTLTTQSRLPQNVAITVNPRPVLVIGQNKTICSGDNVAYEILLSPLNLPLGTTFSWPDPDGVGSATAGVSVAMGAAGTLHINDVLTNVTTAATTVTYVVTPFVGTCPGLPQNVAITVNPIPVLVAGQTKTICSGDNVAYEILLSPLNLPLSTTFSWPDPDGVGSATAGVSVAMGAAGTLHINDVLTNNTVVPIVVTYQITPSSGTCIGTLQNINITISPTPVLQNLQTKTICSGELVNYEILLNPINLPVGVTFSWPDPDGLGSATSKVNLPEGVAGTIHINDQLFNGTASPILVSYSIIPKNSSGCAGITKNIDIIVNPGAVVEAGSSQLICSGGTIALSGSSIGGLATDGTWSIVSSPLLGDGILSLMTSTNTPSNVTFTATVAGNYILRLTTNDPVGPCPQISDDVTITVRSLTDPICGGGGGGCSVPIIAKTDASCIGLPDGSITITSVSGGTGPYTYSIMNGVIGSFQVSNTFPNLPSNSYSVIVKDNVGCMSSVFTIVILNTKTITGSILKTDESCLGGDGVIQIINPIGGTGTYEFSKNNGATFQASDTFNGLSTGVYSIVLRDAPLCLSAPVSVSIVKPAGCGSNA